MGKIRRKRENTTEHGGPLVTGRLPCGFWAGWSRVDYRQLSVGSLLALMYSHVSKGNLTSEERSPTASFNPVPTLLGPNASTVHFYSQNLSNNYW